MDIVIKAKAALLQRFSATTDSKGYTRSPQENLLPGIDLATVEKDLRRGDGNELRTKFRAVHSSSALVVNCFAPFKVNPGSLMLFGKRGAKYVEFEGKLPIFRGGTAPNIDVWIDRNSEAVAVESKLLEYLKPKKPTFSAAYDRLAPPECESSWWQVYEEAKRGAAQHLDRAQLVKHYFGLNKHRKDDPQRPNLTLLYIFWEPLDWEKVNECRRHREEVKAFADAVADSQIPFLWTTYNDLWEEWTAVPGLAIHAKRLKARYQVRLQT